jgi:hypothetical protein
MHKHPEPRPRDDRDAIQDIARDLSEIASHIGQLKGEANAYLTNPNYERLKLRLENALSAVEEAAAVEGRRRVRLSEGRWVRPPRFSKALEKKGGPREAVPVYAR